MALRFLVGMIILVGLGLAACTQAPAQGAASAVAGQIRGGRVVAVSVAPVTKGSVQSVLTYSGNILAKGQVNLVPKTSGRIEKLFVDVGDVVKAGDSIAQLERASARVTVQQAEAALSSAKARLAVIKAGARAEDVAASEAAVRNAQARIDQLIPTDSDIASAKATLAAAQAQLTKAENDLAKLKAGPDPDAMKLAEMDVERTKASLWSAQANRDGQCGRRTAQYQCDSAEASTMASEVAMNQAQAKLDTLLAGSKAEDIANSQKNVESFRASVASAQLRFEQVSGGPKAPDLAAAEATLDQAKYQLEARRRPYSAEDLKIAEAAVDQAQASLDAAKLTLSDTTLTAPFDGVVASRSLSEGALASTQTPVVSLVSKEIDVQINVEESRFGLFRSGLPVAVTVPAYPGQTFTGSVVTIAPVADPKTHTFLVKIAPDNISSKLRPGMFADVKVTADRREGTTLVPKDAVLQQGEKQVLFLAKDGQAVMKRVQLGFSDDKNVEIMEGLTVDDQVIVAGHMGLNNGDRILLPGQGGSPASPSGAAGAPGTPGGAYGGKPSGQEGPQTGPGGQGGPTGRPGGAYGGGYSGKPGGAPGEKPVNPGGAGGAAPSKQ